MSHEEQQHILGFRLAAVFAKPCFALQRVQSSASIPFVVQDETDFVAEAEPDYSNRPQ